MTAKRKEVAWNNIRFLAPPGWEVGQIGARHLMLEDEAGPVMEVKWGVVKGTFSHRAHLKRLTALQSRRSQGRIAETALPSTWDAALSDFDAQGFLWQTEATRGRGAILYCPACRNAALIQFFGDDSARREKQFLAVLKSYRDHRQDQRVLWSIFDLRVLLPQTLQLRRYRFEAGKFELVFGDGRQTIHLHRWAPAGALLGGRNLIQFAETIPECAGGQPRAVTINGFQAVTWSRFPASGWRQKISRLKPKPSFVWFRLWHLDEKNRILSVRAESKHPLDEQLLNQICKAYESV